MQPSFKFENKEEATKYEHFGGKNVFDYNKQMMPSRSFEI